MRPSFLVLILLCLTTSVSLAQAIPSSEAESVLTAEGAYTVPFASEGNRLELALVNTAERAIQRVEVQVTEPPEWLTVEPRTVEVEAIAAGEEVQAAFTFAVLKSAPVGKVYELVFTITSLGVVIGEKTIRLEVEAPKEIALEGNYPNPFNPRTTIGYVLPQPSRVELRVYDMLGREVALLVDGEQVAGHHAAVWEAARYASGVYLYRMVVRDETGQRAIRQRTMLLVK